VITTVAYADLAMAIAEWVYENLRTEGLIGSEGAAPADQVIVDNACESGPQIATGVLARLGLLEGLDGQNRRYYFTEPPNRFRQAIEERRQQGSDYEILVLAAICLVQRDPIAHDLRILLMRLGILHPLDPSGELRWHPDKAHYDLLYEHWPDLMDDAAPRKES
jgi:hypothetical protein